MDSGFNLERASFAYPCPGRTVVKQLQDMHPTTSNTKMFNNLLC